jgi:hypothetical protein
MAKEIINNGTYDGDPSAEKIRTAFDKVNSMFDELYQNIGETGTGDMNRSMYDPTDKRADAFSMGNMQETTVAKILTAQEPGLPSL